jgi:hypothetical protein
MQRLLEFGAIAVFALVASGQLPAQSNPVGGTWKLNFEKSKSDLGPVPKA